jgi:RimJ/RimL family protein N-acetyltransferase
MFELRPIDAGDAVAVQALLADAAVATWLRASGHDGPFTLAECETIVTRGAAHWSAHGFGRSLAWEHERCIGWSLVQHTIAAGRAEIEIGWTVASDRWRHGIGTELGADALRRARALGVRRAVAFTRHDNAASRRVMEKLGLVEEREFEHAGWPHVLYREPGRERRPDFVTRG